MSRGSIWSKWDLHVHTPLSIEQSYGGDNDSSWNKFIEDIESLDKNIKVIGINDYITLDGYKKILEYKRQGKLKNIECFIPVIELRLNIFGGTDSRMSRINYHVIFSDQIEAEQIERHFLNKLTREITIANEELTISTNKGDLEKYGKLLNQSLPENKKTNKSMLQFGFDNLNFELSHIEGLLDIAAFKGKYLTALGKTEWANLRWNTAHIGDKKNIINKADLLFIATDDPDQAFKDIEVLKENNITSTYILDCSDAHDFSDSTISNKLGNTLTWINAEPSFIGLKHALSDYSNRIYIGKKPRKIEVLERNPSQFIKSVSVSKKNTSNLQEEWFNFHIPLNSDLVAIIGNKGSGKSALADIIGHLGQSARYENFSFLNKKRFSEPKMKKSSSFIGTLEFENGEILTHDLDKDTFRGTSEKLIYLPQSYIDDLCNEITEDGNEFQNEIEKVIFTNIPQEERREKKDLQDYISSQCKIHEDEIHQIYKEIEKHSKELSSLYRKSTADYFNKISSELNEKRTQYYNHSRTKPMELPKPSFDNSNKKYSQTLLDKILNFYQIKKNSLIDDILKVKMDLANNLKTQEDFDYFKKTILNAEQLIAATMESYKELLVKLELTDFISLNINNEKLLKTSQNIDNVTKNLREQLDDENPNSLANQLHRIENKILKATELLDFKNKEYQNYLQEIEKWQKELDYILGDEHLPNSLRGLNALFIEAHNITSSIDQTKNILIKYSINLFKIKNLILDIYKKSYLAVQKSIDKHITIQQEMSLNFYADITESNFKELFFNYISQGISSSFYGEKEGRDYITSILSKYNFKTEEEVNRFLDNVFNAIEYNHFKNHSVVDITKILKKNMELHDFFTMLFSLSYLKPFFFLRKGEEKISQLSPGEKGLVLLVFYLLIDNSSKPLLIDQPEENLDNQTIKSLLVPCLIAAKKERQVIIVTHNPNLAVVCGANQIIYSEIDKKDNKNKVTYLFGGLENQAINKKVVDVLEGTMPAFKHRENCYIK